MDKNLEYLLFDDISRRIRYRLEVETPDGVQSVIGINVYDGVQVDYNGTWYPLPEVKPILRSKLSFEETDEFMKLARGLRDNSLIEKYLAFSYLDEHMYDYRGLIKLNLAVENDNNIEIQ